MISTVMATWFLAASAAQWLAGLIARTTAAGSSTSPPTVSAAALATYVHTFLWIGVWGAAAGVLLIVLSPWLKGWAHGVNDPAKEVSQEPDSVLIQR
jgi:POT family proton-dependent oligopeptide transporter